MQHPKLLSPLSKKDVCSGALFVFIGASPYAILLRPFQGLVTTDAYNLLLLPITVGVKRGDVTSKYCCRGCLGCRRKK